MQINFSEEGEYCCQFYIHTRLFSISHTEITRFFPTLVAFTFKIGFWINRILIKKIKRKIRKIKNRVLTKFSYFLIRVQMLFTPVDSELR